MADEKLADAGAAKGKKGKPKKVKKGSKGKKEKGESGKKGKKLPVLIALVVVLLGGGFFGLKMAGGNGDDKPPPVELGDDTHVINLGEFLVNTSDGKRFLKANVLVHLAKDTHLFGEGGGHGSAPGLEMTAPYIDAIRGELAKQTLADLASDDGEHLVKIAIAEAVNKVYHSLHKAEDGEEEHSEEKKEGEEEVKEEGDSTWHSQEGPVLKIYITDYAWS